MSGLLTFHDWPSLKPMGMHHYCIGDKYKYDKALYVDW